MKQEDIVLNSPANLQGLSVNFLHRLDNAGRNNLFLVCHNESTKRRIIMEITLDARRISRDELNEARITSFDEFRAGFHNLSSSTIKLFDQFGELAGDVSGVTMDDGCVASRDLI
jgi:hypothetical protein